MTDEVKDPGTAVAKPQTEEEIMQALFLEGDIKNLKPGDRVKYCWQLAKSVGLNPMTKPFDIIDLGGKTIVYANRTATDQIRKIHGIKSKVLYHGPLLLGDPTNPDNFRKDVYQVVVRLVDKEGRTETATGCVNILNFQGEALANQIMKCWTKAMRRGTLSLGGLGFLDEIEVDGIARPGSDNVPVGFEAQAPKPQPQSTLAPAPVVVEAVAVEVPAPGQPLPFPKVPATVPVATPVAAVPAENRGKKPLPIVKPPTRGV